MFLFSNGSILDLLQKTGMLGAKLVDTPMDLKLHLFVDRVCVIEDPRRYQQLVEKLNYLTCTRLEISYY